MTLDEIVPNLFAQIPELKSISDRELDYYCGDTPGPYAVIGSILYPALVRAIDQGSGSFLLKAFEFFEALAIDPDNRVRDLAYIELIEPMSGDPMRLAKAWRYMGSATKELARRHAAKTKRLFDKEIWLPD